MDEPVRTLDRCGKQSYDFTGSLEGKAQAVRDKFGREAGRLHQRLGRDAHHDDGPTTYALRPTCSNHLFTPGDLVDGRFMGIIRATGGTNRFSRIGSDEYVVWWVFGAMNADGRIELKSQFISLSPQNDLIVSAPFDWCDKSGEWADETAGWHGNDCTSHQPDDMRAARSGHNPWFGCKLGCCYSVIPS